jgi:spore maturation protein CgeB
MRFLIVQPGPAFSVHDLYVGWCEALRVAGQQVFEFNLHDRLTFYGTVLLEAGEGQFKRALSPEQAAELALNGLYAAVLKVRPHVLFIVSGFFATEQLMAVSRAAGVKVVLACTESPYEDDRQLKLAPHADLVLVNDPINIEQYRQVAATEYFPHAYRPTVHRPGPVDPDLISDVCFVGTGYPSRIEFFEAMNLGDVDVLLAGNWQLTDEHSPLRPWLAHDFTDCCDNDDAVKIYRSSSVGLNLYRREASTDELSHGWAMGPREVEMAAIGLPFVRDPRGEGDEVLSMLPTFTTPEEAAEQIRWLIDHDSERDALARKAREAIADRTFDAHAARLLRLLEKE